MKLLEIIENTKGCQFVSIVYRSDVSKKMRKTNNPYNVKDVFAIKSGQVQFNYSYQNGVNNRLQKQGEEPNFVAQSLPWGTWKIANKVIQNGTELHVRLFNFKGAKITSKYFIDNMPATPEQVAEIESFLPKRKESKAQAKAGLDKHQVTPFNVNFKDVIFWNGEQINEQKIA